MKRKGNLFDLIVNEDNISEAFKKASKGKKNLKEVIDYKENLGYYIKILMKQLRNHELEIGYYKFFEIYDPKRRSICAASFPERVLHHAIMNICEPVLESRAIFDSYACRKNKGNHKALLRAKKFTMNYEWFLKLDIKKYFDNIDHKIAIKLLSRCIKDRDVILTFQNILDTYQKDNGKGVPIGNLISQHLANYYLCPFDHFVKEKLRVKAYVRYMDDFLVFRNNKSSLKNDLFEIRNFLSDHLKLELKHNIQLNKCSRGIPFLGYRVFPHKNRLNPNSRKRFVIKFRKYEQKWINKEWTMRMLVRHVEPLVAFTKIADSAELRQDIINKFGVSF